MNIYDALQQLGHAERKVESYKSIKRGTVKDLLTETKELARLNSEYFNAKIKFYETVLSVYNNIVIRYEGNSIVFECEDCTDEDSLATKI